MTRIWWRVGFVGLAVGALALGSAVIGFLHPRSLEADEGSQVRLLVKCAPEELTKVLACLAETRAEVWDLESMQRLTPRAQPVAKPPEGQPTQPATAGPIPPLRDAGKVMRELLAAVATVKPAAKERAPAVTEMIVQQRRALLKLVAATHADVDRVRKALHDNAWLKTRIKQVEPGAAQRDPAGGVATSLSIHFDESRPEPGEAASVTSIDTPAMERITRTHRMQWMYAGAVQQDPNRGAGYMTTSREYTFQTATLAQLSALLSDIPGAQPGLVAYEVRWKHNGAEHILKPIIRVGGRAPVGK